MITFDSSGGLVTIKDGFNVIRVLSENSKNISWGYGSDTTRISFTIDDVTFDNMPATDIAFSGTPLSSATGFKAAVEGLFPNLAGGGSSYLVYTALLSQSGTDAPVATVLQNTLGGLIIWTRDTTGYYIGTLNNAFTIGKTVCFTSISDNKVGLASINCYGNYDVNIVEILQALNTDASQADGFQNVSIEIRVYP